MCNPQCSSINQSMKAESRKRQRKVRFFNTRDRGSRSKSGMRNSFKSMFLHEKNASCTHVSTRVYGSPKK